MFSLAALPCRTSLPVQHQQNLSFLVEEVEAPRELVSDREACQYAEDHAVKGGIKTSF